MEINDSKKSKKMLAMAPPNLCYMIRTNIEANDVLVTSLDECSRRYGLNNKTRIIVGTVLEVEIGPKVATSGRCRTFGVAKFDLGGGYMKATIINISSFKLQTMEPIRLANDGDGGGRAAATTTTTTADTTITD